MDGSGGKVDRLEERKQSDADADGRRRRRIILAAAASVLWMDGWMFGCENAIARFSSSSGLQAERRAVGFLPNPGVQPTLKQCSYDQHHVVCRRYQIIMQMLG